MVDTVTGELATTLAGTPNATALRWRQRDGSYGSVTWAEYARRAARVAGGLRAAGIGRRDRIALLLRNRPEFHFADVGALLAGAVPISIYNSTPAGLLGHLLGHCAARVVITDDSELLERVLMASERAPGLRHVFVIEDRDNVASADVMPFDALLDATPVDIEAAGATARPDDLATVIYTSGTTGLPKGVMLTHANVVATAAALRRAVGRSRDDLSGKRVVSYLPMAHVAERMISHYEGISCGLEVTTCPEVGLIARYLAEVRPHIAFGVPRVWERVHARVTALLPDADPARVREVLGLDEAEFVFTGSAPTPPRLIEWFRSMGIPMAEIYGLSETTGAVATETAAPRAGWAGRALPGVDVRLAGDGEILVRGPNVFAGYLDDEEATRDAIDADGWFHTGDLGEGDIDGFLRVVDRKKELIVTSGGKKISPVHLETALKELPLVSHAAVIGTDRPFLVALLVLDAEVRRDENVEQEVTHGVDVVNAALAPHERVRRWRVVHDDWAADSELLTPTMKLKRRAVEAKYASEIEALYGNRTKLRTVEDR